MIRHARNLEITEVASLERRRPLVPRGQPVVPARIAILCIAWFALDRDFFVIAVADSKREETGIKLVYLDRRVTNLPCGRARLRAAHPPESALRLFDGKVSRPHGRSARVHASGKTNLVHNLLIEVLDGLQRRQIRSAARCSAVG